MKVEFSQVANLDLEAIGDWIAQENPDRAYSFVRELRNECLDLKDFSKRNPVFRNSDRGEIRKRSYGMYVIFYIIKSDVLNIVRILHGSRDFSNLF